MVNDRNCERAALPPQNEKVPGLFFNGLKPFNIFVVPGTGVEPV
jgi:hypothetical protein